MTSLRTGVSFAALPLYLISEKNSSLRPAAERGADTHLCRLDIRVETWSFYITGAPAEGGLKSARVFRPARLDTPVGTSANRLIRRPCRETARGFFLPTPIFNKRKKPLRLCW
jgi:hypothetical protein